MTRSAASPEDVVQRQLDAYNARDLPQHEVVDGLIAAAWFYAAE